ncbi:TPA: DUF2591 family protein, partial [Yersinia enterocolitica]|nr:DUF2591 family protein [Yersinia enterocolitica]
YANKIGLYSPEINDNNQWNARITNPQGEWQAYSQSPLRAAMICYLLSQEV